MPTVVAYHANTTADQSCHKNVYHDHDECQDGKAIKPEHRVSGTGGKPHCKVCANLESTM
jgi:hypothetical protein